jgi:2-polyprenyl-6-methoxyphenol hydroxylase-like FAD-dependent oxidoreductase
MGRPRRITVDSLAGKWHDEHYWSADQASAAEDPEEAARKALKASPCTGAGIAQDRLEPIVRARAIELGADLRLSTMLVSFTQDENGVSATIQPRDGSPEYTIRAQYLIAADGAASPVREALGIGRDGNGALSVVRSVLFRADLDEYLKAGISQFDIVQPDFTARLVTYRDGRWALMFEDDEERDEATLKDAVRRSIGRDDIVVEMITTGRWELAALIANKFSQDRVFLAGDAAHAFPPARGGFGANTGIEDVHNLVWKLDSVLSGLSDSALLETYDTERRAIAWLRHGQIFNREDYAKFAKPEDLQIPRYDDIGMELGQLYRSAAVIGAGDDLPPVQAPEAWHGQPGTRAPHMWVYQNGERVSTLDLVQPDWVLLTTDPRWQAAVAAVVGSKRKSWWKTVFAASSEPRLKLSAVIIGDVASIPVPGNMTGMSLKTSIEQIASMPAGQALLEKHIPEIAGHKDYQRFKSMNLLQLKPLAAKEITEERLTAIEAGLSSLGAPAPAMMSLETPVEQLMANADAMAVVLSVIPEIADHKEYQRFKSMTLRQLQPLAAQQLTPEKLAQVEEGIAHIPNDVGEAEPVDPAAIRAEFCAAFGVGEAGASLVRPDGYVAWRSVEMPDDAAASLSQALISVAALQS